MEPDAQIELGSGGRSTRGQKPGEPPLLPSATLLLRSESTIRALMALVVRYRETNIANAKKKDEAASRRAARRVHTNWHAANREHRELQLALDTLAHLERWRWSEAIILPSDAAPTPEEEQTPHPNP